MDTSDFAAWSFWHVVTRLGEAQILLPAALGLCLWLAHRDEARPVVVRWLAWTGIAAAITTVTKVAVLGWGIGNPTLNFTRVPGHTSFAAAVCPPLFYLTATSRSPAWRRLAWLAGFALAVLIGVSRVKVGAHSWS